MNVRSNASTSASVVSSLGSNATFKAVAQNKERQSMAMPLGISYQRVAGYLQRM